MRRRPIHLPEDLRAAVTAAAAARGQTEAGVIRDALRALACGTPPPRPRLPLFDSSRPGVAEEVDRALRGFGER